MRGSWIGTAAALLAMASPRAAAGDSVSGGSMSEEELSGRSAGTVEIECVGLKNETGQVVCALFDDADSFPKEGHTYAGGVAKIEGSRAVCRFTKVPAGRYAAAVFHDEDGDRKLKTRLGRPVEGFGFSNDAKLRTFGPPKFEDAAFDFDGQSRRMTIKMRYP